MKVTSIFDFDCMHLMCAPGFILILFWLQLVLSLWCANCSSGRERHIISIIKWKASATFCSANPNQICLLLRSTVKGCRSSFPLYLCQNLRTSLITWVVIIKGYQNVLQTWCRQVKTISLAASLLLFKKPLGPAYIHRIVQPSSSVNGSNTVDNYALKCVSW